MWIILHQSWDNAALLNWINAGALAGCWLVELALSQQTRVRVLPSSKCNAGRQSASSVSFFLIYHSYCYHTILHGCWAFSYIHDAQSLCQNLYIHSLFQHNWRSCSLFHFLFVCSLDWRLAPGLLSCVGVYCGKGARFIYSSGHLCQWSQPPWPRTEALGCIIGHAKHSIWSWGLKFRQQCLFFRVLVCVDLWQSRRFCIRPLVKRHQLILMLHFLM